MQVGEGSLADSLLSPFRRMGDPLIPPLPHQLPHGGLDEQMLVLLHSLRLAGLLTQPQSSVIDLRARDTCKPGGAM